MLENYTHPCSSTSERTYTYVHLRYLQPSQPELRSCQLRGRIPTEIVKAPHSVTLIIYKGTQSTADTVVDSVPLPIR